MPNIIGIDLGTTNSAVAIFRHGQAEVLKNLAGKIHIFQDRKVIRRKKIYLYS